jgi:hypothetical protein
MSDVETILRNATAVTFMPTIAYPKMVSLRLRFRTRTRTLVPIGLLSELRK